MFITYKFKLYPKDQTDLIDTMSLQKMLYNAALQERIEAYKKAGKSMSLFDQMKSLTVIRANDAAFANLPDRPIFK